MKLATESFVNDKIEKTGVDEMSIVLSTLVPQKTITNLIRSENITEDLIYTSAGKLTSNTYYVSVKVDCNPGDVLYVYNNGKTYGGLSKIFCNENDNHSELTAGKTNAGRVDGNATSGNLITVPSTEGIVCAYITISKSNLSNAAIYKSNKAVPFAIPYGETAILKDKITQWNGKKWYAYGTSITETDNANKTGKYAPYLAELGGMSLVDKGLGSQGIADSDLGAYENNTGGVMNALLSDDGKSEADLITIEVGANDSGVIAAGNLGEYYDNYDNGDNTFCGRLNKCLQHLQANTNAQILVVGSPFSATTATTWKNKYQMLKAIEDCCDYNGIQFLYPSNTLGPARLNATGNRYLVLDHTTIHQSELGGYIYASHIWEKLKTMPLFY